MLRKASAAIVHNQEIQKLSPIRDLVDSIRWPVSGSPDSILQEIAAAMSAAAPQRPANYLLPAAFERTGHGGPPLSKADSSAAAAWSVSVVREVSREYRYEGCRLKPGVSS
jgi:hypothetical protein